MIPGSLRTDDMSTRSYETGHTGGKSTSDQLVQSVLEISFSSLGVV